MNWLRLNLQSYVQQYHNAKHHEEHLPSLTTPSSVLPLKDQFCKENCFLLLWRVAELGFDQQRLNVIYALAKLGVKLMP